MSRIHGDAIIKRKENIVKQNDYHKYEDDLKEDFHHMCGYCGKKEEVTKKGFEIDHFVPVSLDKNKKLVYSNLVYCCFTCNRKKSADWPTQDTNMPNDGVRGYEDPASPQFDKHLSRDDVGQIIAKTDIGEYMIKKLKFNKRPMQAIHKLNMLYEKKKLLYKKLEVENSIEKYKKFVNLQKSVDDLMTLMFNIKE